MPKPTTEPHTNAADRLGGWRWKRNWRKFAHAAPTAASSRRVGPAGKLYAHGSSSCLIFDAQAPR